MERRVLISIIKKLITEYGRRLGIPESYIKRIRVELYPFKLRLGRTIITKKYIKIKVNTIFLDFFDVDEEKAMEVLKFIVAHEMAHVYQYYKTGKTFLSEIEANKIAKTLTGISEEECEKLVIELLNKIKKGVRSK